MRDFLAKLVDQLRSIFSKLNRTQKFVILGVVAGVVIAMITLFSFTGKPTKVLLYNDLNPKDFGNITKKLLNALFAFVTVLEYLLIVLFGTLSNWGGSIMRVFGFGIFTLISFSAVYYIYIDISFLDALIRSFDITFIGGYSKYTATYDFPYSEIVFIINMIVGLIWYAILIPTIIAHTSKTKR